MSSHSTAFLQLAHQARSRIAEVTPNELCRIKPCPVIIDVREADEYAQGHIPGAHGISRGILEQKVDLLIPDVSTPVVVYCSGGERGALAADSLLRMGYQNVRSLKGGLQNWLESGGTVETSKRRHDPLRGRPFRAEWAR
ncbi:MAG TPA: rhodanese-like domain-containing protein [Chthoniobacterales bacterium]